MSDNTPTFNDALEAIGTLLNIDGAKLFGELFEDVELSRIAFLKKPKAESAEKANDYSAVDEALDQLGVNKPVEEDAPDVSYEVLSEARKRVDIAQMRVADAMRDLAEVQAGAKGTIARLQAALDEPKTALSKWDVAIRDRNWASWAVVEAERVEIGPDLDGYDAGFNAYIGEDLVFHAPAGTYHYVRKVG